MRNRCRCSGARHRKRCRRHGIFDPVLQNSAAASQIFALFFRIPCERQRTDSVPRKGISGRSGIDHRIHAVGREKFGRLSRNAHGHAAGAQRNEERRVRIAFSKRREELKIVEIFRCRFIHGIKPAGFTFIEN